MSGDEASDPLDVRGARCRRRRGTPGSQGAFLTQAQARAGAIMASIETESTAGSESRNLDDPIRFVDLEREIAEALEQLPTAHGGHTARTLFKQSMHRVVLLVLKAGSVMPEHRADGESSLFVISGRIAVDVGDRRHELSRGGLLGLAFGIPHAVTAHEDAVILLTLSNVR